jgi:hypothetical protein
MDLTRIFRMRLSTLGLTLMVIAHPATAKDHEFKLSRVSHQLISAEADNVHFGQLLRWLGAHAGIDVETTAAADRYLRYSGALTGTVGELLQQLLENENYVVTFSPADGRGARGQRRVARILVMGPAGDGRGAGGAARPEIAPTRDAALSRKDGPGTGVGPEGGNRLEGSTEVSAAVQTAKDPAPRSINAAGNGAERLRPSGTALSSMLVDPTDAQITRTVQLGGDVPLATHVITKTTDGKTLQRTALGEWVPWDRDEATLIDNRFKPSGGALTFKVDDGSLMDRFFPVSYTVAYRTETGLNFGVFAVMPRQPMPR